MDFKILLKKGQDGWITVSVPSLPGCISQGRTEEEAKKNIKEAISLHLSLLVEDGLPLKHDKTNKEILVAVAV